MKTNNKISCYSIKTIYLKFHSDMKLSDTDSIHNYYKINLIETIATSHIANINSCLFNAQLLFLRETCLFTDKKNENKALLNFNLLLNGIFYFDRSCVGDLWTCLGELDNISFQNIRSCFLDFRKFYLQYSLLVKERLFKIMKIELMQDLVDNINDVIRCDVVLADLKINSIKKVNSRLNYEKKALADIVKATEAEYLIDCSFDFFIKFFLQIKKSNKCDTTTVKRLLPSSEDYLKNCQIIKEKFSSKPIYSTYLIEQSSDIENYQINQF